MKRSVSKDPKKILSDMAQKMLPQASVLDEEAFEYWIERASVSLTEEKAQQKIQKATRLSSEDMGAFLASARGRFHPHATAENVVREKLFLDPPAAELPHQSRKEALTPIVREMLREDVLRNGGKVFTEGLEKIQQLSLEDHPWIENSIGDLIIENNKVVLIDYRTPGDSLLPSTNGTPFHHEVDMHYQLMVAQLAGIEVHTMRRCFFNTQSWSYNTIEMPCRFSMAQEILDEGDRVWQEHVLRGQQWASLVQKNIRQLSDFRNPDLNSGEMAEDLTEKSQDFLRWSIIHKLSAEHLERLQKDASDACPVSALSLEVERIDGQGVRFSIEREMDVDGLMELATELLMDKTGYTLEEAQAHLNHPNYWTQAEFSSDHLVQCMDIHLGVDPQQDHRFSSAVVNPSVRRTDTLLDLIRSIDRDGEIRLDRYVKTGRITMQTAAVRNQLDKNARAEVTNQVREALEQSLSQMPSMSVQDAPRKPSRRP